MFFKVLDVSLLWWDAAFQCFQRASSSFFPA